MIHALKADLIPIILESINILEEQGELFNSVIDARDIETSIEIPKNRANGDLSSNIALRKSKEFNLDALKLANLIANSFNSNLVKQSKQESLWHNVEVARPGFLNFRINPFAKLSRLCTVLTEQDYGWEKSKNIEKIILEYVSANPTGPLHVGHARQAVLGDAISNILSKAGHDTYREFYYNDAGNQIENLALSVWARLNGYDQNSEEFPKDGYRGSYIIEIANKFRILKKAAKLTKFEKSKKLLNEIKNFSIGCLRDEQNSDLELLGISFDNFALESDFYQNGLVDDVITSLKKKWDDLFHTRPFQKNMSETEGQGKYSSNAKHDNELRSTKTLGGRMGKRELLSVIRYAQGQQPSEAPKCPLEQPQRAPREPKRCQNGSRRVAERFQKEPKSV